ncbi:MAG: dicarboxylate/amino acid:cation symporter [Chitinophagaceae bacterium]|nr:MAG: dicarboxylate/amino acid:cation symporter [Chitinophagaceae bacterium]
MKILSLFKNLYFQVIVAIVTGILLGHYFPDLAVSLKPLGDGFIKLVKMMIVPVVFCTIVSGIAGMENMKKVGRVGLKAIIYFEVLTTIALITGLVVVNVLKPGDGMHVDASNLNTSAIAGYTEQAKKPESTIDFLLHIIPDTVMGAFAGGNLLQVLLFSILLGYGLTKIGSNAVPVTNFIESFSKAIFAIIHMIMKLAPLGALGAMSFTIGKYGLVSLLSLGKLMGVFYLTCIFFVFVVLGTVLRIYGFSILKLLKYLKEELLIVLGTSSSESALPRLMEKLEKAGCSKPVVGLVVPTGYSFNLDGTSIYLTMAAVFIAQAMDIPLSLGDQLTLLAVLLISSKGAAGVTGSGFITLAATLPLVGNVPVAGVALILGIDRFMSEARALTNIIGNAVATIVVSGWENEIDRDEAKKHF